jgi:uncharacterized protein (TIGR03067 family)
MKLIVPLLCSAILGWCSPSLRAAAEPESGFKAIFNGTDLTGWEGLPQFWSVKDGAITGQTTKENPAKGNTFLIWKAGEVDDFELRLSYKLTADGGKGFANSGVQYRSKIVDPSYFVVGGYQGDMEVGKSFSGILYEERGRGILAQRGQKVVITASPNDPNRPKIDVVGTLGDSAEIQSRIKPEDWNEYVIIAKGNHLQHFINGLPTVDVTDEQTSKAAKSGILALQLHAGDPMTARFKNIRIKSLSGRAVAASDVERVQGNWVAAQIVDNGEPASADALSIVKLKITGKEFSLQHPDGLYQGKFDVTPSSTPKRMNATLDDGTEVSGIYEISGDKFQVCYSQPGSARPAALKSAAGSEHVLVVYKRQSP